ncbi:unnamed protein product [Prunus armeniaca]
MGVDDFVKPHGSSITDSFSPSQPTIAELNPESGSHFDDPDNDPHPDSDDNPDPEFVYDSDLDLDFDSDSDLDSSSYPDLDSY